jgi:exonuclease III
MNPKEDNHTPPTTKITRTIMSLISFNFSGLNSPIKRQRVRNWIHKQDSSFCCMQETHLSDKDRFYLSLKGWKKSFPSKWSQERS